MKEKRATADPPKIEISPEMRFHLINDAAYFRAVKNAQSRGKTADYASAWCEVEAEIDSVIRKHSH